MLWWIVVNCCHLSLCSTWPFKLILFKQDNNNCLLVKWLYCNNARGAWNTFVHLWSMSELYYTHCLMCLHQNSLSYFKTIWPLTRECNSIPENFTANCITFVKEPTVALKPKSVNLCYSFTTDKYSTCWWMEVVARAEMIMKNENNQYAEMYMRFVKCFRWPRTW